MLKDKIDKSVAKCNRFGIKKKEKKKKVNSYKVYKIVQKLAT